MASTAELELLIKARDQASGVLGAVSKKAGGLANVAGKAVRAGALAGGVAVAGLGIAALKMGLDFEKSMAQVKTLLPDLNEEGFAQLQAGVFDLSKELGIATDQMVPALYQAISAGVPPDNVLDFMTIAGKAAIGGATDLETAVDGITGVVNTYGAEVVDATKASDIMFTAVRLGKTTFGELSSSLSQVLPTAQSLGVSFEDVSAQLAVMTARNVPTAQAVTQMRQAMVEASKGGSKLSDAIIDLTGKSFSELIDKGATTSEIFDGLRSSMPEQEFKDLFGSVEGMNAALLISGPNAQATADAMGQMGDATGASEAAFAVMGATAGRKLTKAINILKVELTKLGVKALPFIAKAVGAVSEVLSGFFAGLDRFNDPDVTSKGAFGFGEKLFVLFRTKLVPALQAVAEVVKNDFIPAFTSGMEVIGPIVEDLFGFIINNKAVLIAAIVAIGVAIVLAFGPVAIAAAAIIGFIVLVGLLRDNWDAIKKQFEDVQAFVTNIPIIGALVEAMVAVVKDKIDAMIEIFLGLKALFEEVVTFVTAIVEGDWAQAWDSAKEIVKIALNLLIDYIRVTFLGTIIVLMKELGPKILAALGDLAGLLINAGIDLLKGLKDGAVEQASKLFVWLTGLPASIGRQVGDLASLLWFSGWELIAGLWAGIKARATQLFTDLANLAVDILGAITDPLGIFSPSRAFREVGENMMKGLMQGLEKQSVQVNATVGNIASGTVAAAAGIPAPAGAVVAGAGPISPTGAEDRLAEAIALAVARELPAALEGVSIELDGELVGQVVSRRQGTSALLLSRGG